MKALWALCWLLTQEAPPEQADALETTTDTVVGVPEPAAPAQPEPEPAPALTVPVQTPVPPPPVATTRPSGLALSGFTLSEVLAQRLGLFGQHRFGGVGDLLALGTHAGDGALRASLEGVPLWMAANPQAESRLHLMPIGGVADVAWSEARIAGSADVSLVRPQAFGASVQAAERGATSADLLLGDTDWVLAASYGRLGVSVVTPRASDNHSAIVARAERELASDLYAGGLLWAYAEEWDGVSSKPERPATDGGALWGMLGAITARWTPTPMLRVDSSLSHWRDSFGSFDTPTLLQTERAEASRQSHASVSAHLLGAAELRGGLELTYARADKKAYTTRERGRLSPASSATLDWQQLSAYASARIPIDVVPGELFAWLRYDETGARSVGAATDPDATPFASRDPSFGLALTVPVRSARLGLWAYRELLLPNRDQALGTQDTARLQLDGRLSGEAWRLDWRALWFAGASKTWSTPYDSLWGFSLSAQTHHRALPVDVWLLAGTRSYRFDLFKAAHERTSHLASLGLTTRAQDGVAFELWAQAQSEFLHQGAVLPGQGSLWARVGYLVEDFQFWVGARDLVHADAQAISAGSAGAAGRFHPGRGLFAMVQLAPSRS